MVRIGLRWVLLVMGIASVASVACTQNESSEELEETNTQHLTALELTCESADHATKLDISPGLGGSVIEGKLTIAQGSAASETSLFVCREPDADGGSSLIVSCNERPTPSHPERWSIEVTKQGSTYTAALRKGTDAGAEQVLSCATPNRPADAGPTAPTYADVKPIIDSTCGGCHRSTFSSVDRIRQKKAAMISLISSGAMPRGNPRWRDTDAGKMVLDFLRTSPEL